MRIIFLAPLVLLLATPVEADSTDHMNHQCYVVLGYAKRAPATNDEDNDLFGRITRAQRENVMACVEYVAKHHQLPRGNDVRGVLAEGQKNLSEDNATDKAAANKYDKEQGRSLKVCSQGDSCETGTVWHDEDGNVRIDLSP